MDKKYIIATADFSGLGFAKKLHDEGYDVTVMYDINAEDHPDNAKYGRLVGQNLVPRMAIDQIWPLRNKYRNHYWIFDQNNLHEQGDILRKEGFKHVLGSNTLTHKMEHDREFGVALVEKAGLKSPPTMTFTTIEEGIAFLDANEEKAYVFKPNQNDDGWETYCPDSEKDVEANEEVHDYMDALNRGNSGGYVLQERIKGVEANFELWVHNGTPYFAVVDLECKRKNNDDFGGLCGGAQDIGFAVPIDCKGVRDSVGKLMVLPEFKNFTGFLDMNIIIADNGPYFLEFCARFGYPEHPTIFFTLAKIPLGELFAKMIDGDVKDFYDNFRYGFGAGITLYNDRPKKGLPLHIPEDVEKHFFHFDSYKRGDKHLLAGFDKEVGMMTGHGFTIMDAAEEAISNAKKVAFPNRAFRTDLDKDAYPSNPRDRYLALEAMRYLV